MRESLTILAIFLILVLTAALAVPYFVDWTAERGLVEKQLTDLLGHTVKIRGGIDLKVLPTPFLQLANVEVSDPAAGADIKAAELHLEIALTALLRGEVDFVEARLVRPQIRVRLQDGALPRRQPGRGLYEQMQFERIAVEDGSITIDDPDVGRSYAFDKINLNAEAASLIGPFKANGTVAVADEPTSFRLETAAREGERMRFKLIVDANKQHPRADLDASLIFHPQAKTLALPGVRGTVNLSGTSHDVFALPWRLAGSLDANLRKASISNVDLRVGDEDRAASLAGSINLDFGAKPSANATLKGQQIDLDRLLATDDRPAMQRLALAFGAMASSTNLLVYGLPVAIDWSADTALLGGEKLSDLSGGMQVSGEQTAALRFAGSGPHGSRLTLDGNLETGSAAGFKGHVAMGANDVARFIAWLKSNLPQTIPADFSLPVHAFDVSGNADLSQVGFVGSGLTLRLNGSTLTGTLAYTKAIGSDAARLFADLSAPSIDLEGLPDFSRLAQQTKVMDVALRLNAQAVKVSGLALGEVDTGQIDLKFDKTGNHAVLDHLTISGLDGADLTARGQWDGHSGTVAIKLDAERLGELADLARHIVPNAASDFIASHADEFSPAHLDLSGQAQTAADGTLSLSAFNLAGTAQHTKMNGRVNSDPQKPDAQIFSLRVDAPDSTALLRQIGFSALSAKNAKPGFIELKAKGTAGHPLDASLTAALAGTNLDFHGSFAPTSGLPHAKGSLKLTSTDVSGLAQSAGRALPNLAGRLPAEVSASIDLGSVRLAFNNLNGSFAGSTVTGDLAYASEEGITGTLALDRTSLAALTGLVLGPPQVVRAGTLWSDAKFAAPLKSPRAYLSMRVGTLDLWRDISARDAHFELALSGGDAGLQLGLHNLSMKIGVGSAAGDLKLRRSGATAAAEGHISLHDCQLAMPTAEGRLSAELDLAGTGDSAAALINGLAGTGTVQLSDLILPRSDPGALARVFSAVEEDRLGIDETQMIRVLSAEFDKQSSFFGDAGFDAGVAAGVLRLAAKGNKSSRANPGVVEDLEGDLDLNNLTLDQTLALTLVALPKNWSGPAPQVTLQWHGPITNPARDIEATSFVNALAARAIARESARIQAQEFDIHEHAFFLVRLESERRREKEKEDAEHAAELEALRNAEAARLEQQKLDAQSHMPDETTTSTPETPLSIGRSAPAPLLTTPFTAPGTQDPSAAGRY